MGGWYRRWILATRTILARDDLPQLRTALAEVELVVANWLKDVRLP